MNDLISRLLAHERIRAARHHIERTDEGTLARQAALSAIPAPTGAEGRRAAHMAELFRTIGLCDVMVDHAGNVHGWLRKNGEKSAPVVLAAHLDTVFGAEVDVAVERRGQRLEGPGISDNARGLAALVAVAEAMVAARVPVTRPILFAATVGEEGSGDLRGVKYLLNGKHDVGAQHAAPLPNATTFPSTPAAFIALDGAGLDRVIHRALGSKRYHVTFRGPGGHSWAAFGVANPANAVGRATALLADLPPSRAPRTTCAVVGLGGGTGRRERPPRHGHRAAAARAPARRRPAVRRHAARPPARPGRRGRQPRARPRRRARERLDRRERTHRARHPRDRPRRGREGRRRASRDGV